jgi:hypothetical protein
MAKGVKKIKCVEGLCFPKLSVPNKLLIIPPDQLTFFQVSEWFQDTTPAEKKKEVTWIWQTQDRGTIIRQKTIPFSQIYGVQLTKKLCGSYTYYLEASIFGKQNSALLTGLHFGGHCDKKIISSKWSTTKGGASIKNKNKNNYISYGHIIHLHLETEGINGNKLTIEVYNQQSFRSDKLIRTITGVNVEDGEVNLKYFRLARCNK